MCPDVQNHHFIFSPKSFQRHVNQIVSTVEFVKELNVNVRRVILVNIVKLVSENRLNTAQKESSPLNTSE